MCLSIGAQGQVIQKVVTLAGTDGIVNGTGIGAHFFSPWHVVLRDSILLISDQEAGAVRRMSLKTKKVTTLFANQPAISGMALTRSKDSLYFSSNGNILKLYRFSTQTITILDTLVETPIDAMICTRNGNLIFSGGNSHRVGMRTPAGVYSRLAGKMNTSGNVDGIDTVARFNTISAFALSQTEDTLYISDRFNSKIRRLNRVTKTVSTLPFVAALGLFGPRNLALNPKKDSLFVANFSNHTILRYSL
ncbi:MAG TPA: beta-propeller fold lactonase family protein, partial [Catalimonadaceae bacterium]|nr:beta-propeller fold lactonase family protein [Catalimonadaceae bacterium]